ncbi:MAG: uridylate kinase [Christensenellales bacterium]|jgi:glutamate 5-kinase
MAHFDFEVVGKIGSMALIRKNEGALDYNVFSRIGEQLRPGIIWVSSGAVEIGRLDYMRRNGGIELLGDEEDTKTDYAAQGQAILMENYRRFIAPQYSVRQLLVEHTHFNDPEKREHIRRFLMRCPAQNAIPIVNYNDPVSFEENRKLELQHLRDHTKNEHLVECVDNDETAAVICTLVRARYLVLFTSAEGIYAEPTDPSTLIPEIGGANVEEVIENIRFHQQSCVGASRKGANGAKAKLEFCIEPVRQKTTVFIASANYKLTDVIAGKAPCTRIGAR